ncbi:MAG: hypothetical protein EAZ95_16135 [Bacteroidetes bacterium]|nr:MAG: hypothetical protein EAZ95_16135 [Bacteroidota bacterium]
MSLKLHNLQEWETPQRQSPAGLFILFIRTCWEIIKQFWIVLLYYVLRGRQENQPFATEWLFWGFFGLSIVITVIKFWFYKFQIKDDHLHIHSGWWKRKHLSIPLASIQSVQIEQGVWQQLFRIAKVSFDSTGSESVEAKIDALSLKKAEALKQILLQESEGELATAGETISKPERKTYRLNDLDTLKLSLSANHFRAFFVLLVFTFKFFDDAGKMLDADQREAMEAYTDQAINALSWVFFVGVFLVVAFISVAVSAFRIFLEYYNFTMTETDKGWRVSHGLLTQKQKVITRSKIQLVTYRANWLRGLLDFWFIDMSITGQDKLKRQAQINVPITNLVDVQQLAEQYLPQAPVREQGERISPAYWGRKALFLSLPVSLLLWGVLYLISGELLIALAVAGVVLAYWLVHLVVWRSKFRWLAQEEGLTVFKGVWGKSYTLLQWQKIQDVSLSQTIYQRQKRLATLKFSTAGGEITLPYLPLATAEMLLNQTLYRIESRQEAWL